MKRLLAFLLLLAPLAVLAQASTPDYTLGAGDTIRVQVFQNPDLTVETRVSESGAISYPLIGSAKVGGLSIGAAEQVIAKALQAGSFIKQPQVNIVLLQARGSQVSVLGMVGRPGRYPLETFNIRLSEMVAIAGGVAPTGADTAIVSGTREGKPFRREVDIAGMYLENRPQEDFVLAGGDAIYVHRAPMFYIYGEVQRPGSYRVERAMTIRQALAQGGGPTLRGTERGFVIYRRSAGGAEEALNPALSDAVRADDVYFVKESLF